MSLLERKRTIDRGLEKSVLISLITSDKVVKTTLPFLDYHLFESQLSKTIVKWIIEYAKVYQEAPKKYIQDIFLQKRVDLTESLEEEIADFLELLSNEYETENLQNEEYQTEKTIKYLKSRQLQKTAEKVLSLVSAGELDAAEGELARLKLPNSYESDWISPFDDNLFINSVFDEDTEYLFRLGGGLDQLVGPLKRGYLLGVMSFTKRGKTWYLQEIADWAMTERKRVAWFSLEMKGKDFSYRLYQKTAAAGDEEKSYKYPVFDCAKNQNNKCLVPQRTSRLSAPLEYDPEENYSACTFCREKNPKEFVPAVWYTEIARPKLTSKLAKERIQKYRKYTERNLFKLKSFPAFSANVQDIMTSLDILEAKENWIPDVVILDYADVLRSEDPRLTGRDAIDANWKFLKGMASAREALVVTATQSNRASAKQDLLEEDGTSEDIRKLCHTDIMLGLSQTEEEKRKGVIRIGVLEHRWRAFDRRKLLMMLQQLELGQTNLDSEIVFWNTKNEKKKYGDQ